MDDGSVNITQVSGDRPLFPVDAPVADAAPSNGMSTVSTAADAMKSQLRTQTTPSRRPGTPVGVGPEGEGEGE
jgi:hypothetical protein